jgi:HSP20 family protein
MLAQLNRHRIAPTARHLLSAFTDPLADLAEWTCVESNAMPLDISEKEGDIFVRAALPGFTKDQIEVQLHNNVLTIKAEASEESQSENERFLRRERRFGSVARRIALPENVANSEVRAELKDGVLHLHIPQSEAAKPRKIAIS